MKGHKLYESKTIINYKDNIISDCNLAFRIFQEKFDSDETTWMYEDYNIFSLTSSNILFYDLYKELNYCIRDYFGDQRPLWLGAWINYHANDKVEESLGFHYHLAPYHGYISIDPKNTTTIFKNGLEIENKVGQIYIGPGQDWGNNGDEWDHKVVVNGPYEGNRITIGFDVTQEPNIIHSKANFYPLI